MTTTQVSQSTLISALLEDNPAALGQPALVVVLENTDHFPPEVVPVGSTGPMGE